MKTGQMFPVSSVTDPRIVKNPEVIESITYRELRELSYMGATVLHEDAIFPVRKEGIPINIKTQTDRKTRVLLLLRAHARNRNLQSQVLQVRRDSVLSILRNP